jgi:hypothetical protein
MEEFADHINKLLQKELTYINWSVLLDFLDANRTEIHTLSSEQKDEIYQKLESYRTELPNQPIRREEIKPNIYDIF